MSDTSNLCDKFRRSFNRAIAAEICKPEIFSNPQTDFSRNRNLNLLPVISISYRADTRSISASLPQLHPSLSSASLSAISQARQKIKSSLYIGVFNRMNQGFRYLDTERFKSYRLLAVDGSELRVSPDGNDLSTYGGSKKGGKRHYFHANMLYDVLNHTCVDMVLQPGSEKNEDSAFLDLAERVEDPNVIYTCDRGYECLMTFHRLDQSGKHFVIRIKDESSATSILKHYPTPETEEYDIPFDVTLTSRNNKKVKENWDTYKYISSYPKHPEFSNGVTELPLHGRAVRFKVKCGEKESFITLFTNLSADSFSTDDLKEIYRLRWQIKISFRDLKRELGLEHIHGRKKEVVIGEVYAKMTIYNMNSRIRNHVEKRKKTRLRLERAVKRKTERKIDFTFLMAATRSFFWNEGTYTGAGLIKLLERKTESVRPDRPRR